MQFSLPRALALLLFEIVAFDNKASPQETLTVLRQIVDRGIRFVAQGNGSGVALALVDALGKHSERNPAQSIVFLNYAAVDPALTNSKCSSSGTSASMRTRT